MTRPRWPLDHADTRLVVLGLVLTCLVLWAALLLGLAVRIFLLAKGV